jgi:hypothetical protein
MCVVVIALLAPFTASPASAQNFDERVFFTFSGPVELPGVALPAGKYIFRLPDPTSTHNVVQVLSGDGMTLQRFPLNVRDLAALASGRMAPKRGVASGRDRSCRSCYLCMGSED